jgi:hypothetical protein
MHIWERAKNLSGGTFLDSTPEVALTNELLCCFLSQFVGKVAQVATPPLAQVLVAEHSRLLYIHIPAEPLLPNFATTF